MGADSVSGGSSADVHYLRVKSDLLSGRFPPGTVLLETALGKMYGVSRTPMREALARLAQDRLIERSARGFVVRERSAEEILAIYEARIPLETTAAALAAERRGSLDLERLDHLLDARRAATDPATHVGLNEQFHRALRAAARSEVIASTLEQLDDLLTVYRPDRSAAKVVDRTVEEHEAVLDAVRETDGERARAAMSEHLVRMRDLRVATLVRLSTG
ncbi:GntR family transcriptional regulator [Saccharopolyspora sp. K220]|uniref:GntR family transcriptional regulator n=1 Tax=Saccharopolyspora soli TaxID=2926618 RepID=UPI001F57D314|nr:GntR family transcriptional regulator [Saccharopolyspora soli]MCI2416003.1 GntR family transcriptional regulator [Saccharopolyspora soli]